MADNFLQYGGINGFLADSLQRGINNRQQYNQANAQALAETAQIVGQNLEKNKLSQLLQSSINEDGSLNNQAYLSGLAQINPGAVAEQYMKLGKNESEVRKNLAAAAKDEQDALKSAHDIEQNKLSNQTKNIDGVISMLRQSKGDEDKNRIIKYAESNGIPIPAYYKNTPWSPEMVQQATQDLLAAKDDVKNQLDNRQFAFDQYKQQYSQGQDALTNQQRDKSLALQQERNNLTRDQNSANNFSRDNASINKFQTVIDKANAEFRTNVGKSQKIQTAAKDMYNEIAALQAQTGARGGDFKALIESKAIPSSTFSMLQDKLNTVKGLMFLEGAQTMKGLGALSDADAARLEKTYGTFDITKNFDYLKSILMDAYNSAVKGLQNGAKGLSDIRKTNNTSIDNIKSGWRNNPQYANNVPAMGSNQLTNAPVVSDNSSNEDASASDLFQKMQ